jgi:hypothetical protein
LRWEKGQRGSLGVVHGGVARLGEVGDGGGDLRSPVVPEWSVTGYALERSSWRWQRGNPWLEAAVHVEALTVARAEGIWWRRHEPEVDGGGLGFGKLRGTDAQLMVVVAGPGARWSGLATERCPQ